jgi:hypothetical protein
MASPAILPAALRRNRFLTRFSDCSARSAGFKSPQLRAAGPGPAAIVMAVTMMMGMFFISKLPT